MITIHDCSTGEVIERELTESERAQQAKDFALAEKTAKELAEKLAKKAELLAKLGITEDEVRILLG